MYNVTIVTKYNTIHLVVEDIYSDEFKELLEQPYIVSVEIHKQLVLKK